MALPPSSASAIEEDKKVDAAELDHVEQAPQLGRGRTKQGANTQLDDAARLLDEVGGHVEYSMDDMKRVLRKIDIYVCIPMCITYWM